MASSFSTLRQRGYGTFYAIKIEGIPYIFTEGPVPYRVDSESEPGVPSGYTGQSAAFAIVAETTVDQELDREASVARAKSLPIVLSWDVLEADGILDELFRRPAYSTALTANVDAADTTINVAKTASFGAVSHAGQFYIGRELIKYSGTTATSFTGCTRGYLGYKYKFRQDDPGSHGLVTPTPHSWRGRFVTVYEHLVSPEGRILDSTWTEGTYQRELWKGYVTAPPVPAKLGMRLEVANLIRLAAQDLGSSLQGQTIGSDVITQHPVYVDIGAQLSVDLMWTGGAGTSTSLIPSVVSGSVAGDYPVIGPGVMTISEYARAAAEQLEDDLSSYTQLLRVNAAVYTGPPGRIQFTLTFDSTVNAAHPFQARVTSSAYWARNLSTDWQWIIASASAQTEYSVQFDVYLAPTRGDYLAIRDIEGDSAIDFSIDDTGIAVVTAGDSSEIIRWDAKYAEDYLGADVSPVAVLHIAERMVGAEYATVEQIEVDLHLQGSIDVISGKIGTLDDVAETMLESSGTGTRGAKDTLGLGFGLGVPEAWIDIDAVGTAPITTEKVPLLAIGRSSFAAVFSGWYQLAGWCLSLRRDSAGVLQFQRVDVVPAQVITTSGAGYLGTSLGKSDVVVGGTEVPRLIIAPNQVIIDTTAGPYESAQYTYNAVGRIQSEGVYTATLSVPGGRAALLSAAVLSIMARGKGQSIISFAVAPWVDIQVGDPVSVTVAHPLLYDWADGTRQPSNIPGRCVGWTFNLKTGEQGLTILLDGLLAPAFWLCPVEAVTLVSGNDVTVGDGVWWQSGETVRFYNRGKEATESGDLLVDTVSGNVLTLNAAPPAWLTAANSTRATHPLYSSASTDQQGPFMFARSDRFWRL